MEIKEAIRITKNAPNEKWQDVVRAAETIQEAIKNGYTLCKVDEAIQKMEEVKENYYFQMAMDKAIDIVKGACE